MPMWAEFEWERFAIDYVVPFGLSPTRKTAAVLLITLMISRPELMTNMRFMSNLAILSMPAISNQVPIVLYACE
jgi:hypothetical protein